MGSEWVMEKAMGLEKEWVKELGKGLVREKEWVWASG